MVFEILVGAMVLYATWSVVTLQINYRRASSMGVPLIILPVDPLNVIFMILEPHLFRLLDLLPFELPSFLYYLRRGWHFRDKANTHLAHGPIWAHVTPRDVQDCLGVKFSQVEFVAVVARLLWQHRLSLVKERDTETESEVITRVWKVVNDCDAQMLLRMKNPERVQLRLQPV